MRNLSLVLDSVAAWATRSRRAGESRSTRRHTSGFSLIEVLFVTGCMSVIFAIAIPNVQAALQAYRLQVATQLVATDLAEARSRATEENRRVTVAFVRGESAFGRDTDADGAPNEIRFLPVGTTFADNATITFGPRGELLQPPLAGLPAGATSQIQVMNGGQTRTIQVSLRGRIAVQ